MSQCMVGALCQAKDSQPLIFIGESMCSLYSGKGETIEDCGRIEP